MNAARRTAARALRAPFRLAARVLHWPGRVQHDQSAELTDHLGELRGRLVIVLAGIAVSFAVAFAVHRDIIELMTSALPEGQRKLVTFGVAEPFLNSIKVSLYAGFILALPLVMSQVWAFFAPSVQPQARRSTALFALFALILGAVGVAFGFLIALPSAVQFLTTYDSAVYDIQIRAANYYAFTLAVLLACALVFELPVFILGMVRFGILSVQRLRTNRRMGYAAVAALAVLLPGVDPVTTALEMVPLVVLFELSIWLSVFFDRRWHPKAVTAAAS